MKKRATPKGGAASMTLETAHAVIAAHRAAEQAQKNVELAAYVGRFFKYRNCYSCPASDADYWWLYAAATGLTDYGSIKGWSFQHTSEDELQLRQDATLANIAGGGYGEISAAEFWKAAAEFRRKVTERLTPPSGEKSVS